MEADADTRRRWLLPAAILAIFALLAFAAWRWHAWKNAHKAQPVPTAQAPQPQAAPAPPSDLTREEQPAAAAEPKHSPFSPPPIVEAVPSPAKKPRPAEPPADVTIHKTQPPEAAASDLPEAVTKPTAATAAAPGSRFVAARVLERVEPAYPETAGGKQTSGKVVVKATISKSGSVTGVQWVSGNELFRDSAFAAVKQWRYQPASLNGKPIESDLEIVLQFHRPTSE